MRRFLALPLLALVLVGCRDYNYYAPLVSQKGLIPAGPVRAVWAGTGGGGGDRPRTGLRLPGHTPADFGAQSAAAVTYAQTLSDVVNVTATASAIA